MAIKMDLISFNRECISCTESRNRIIGILDSIISAINVFLVDSELIGYSYDAAKEFFSFVILPVLDGQKLYLIKIDQKINALYNDYLNTVDKESWDENDLILLIEKQTLETGILKSMSRVVAELSDENVSDNILNNINTSINNIEKTKAVYQDVLNRLRNYDGVSKNYFDELVGIKDCINSAISSTKFCFDKGMKIYSLPTNMDSFNKLKNMTKEIKNPDGTDNLSLQYNFSYEENEAVNTFMSVYGVDKYTAQQLVLTRRKIDEKYPNDIGKENDYKFFRLIGGCYYDTDKLKELWNFGSGTIKDIFGMSDCKKALRFLGVPNSHQLYYNIRLQHSMCESYPSKKSAEKMYNKYYYKGNSKKFDEFFKERVKSYRCNGRSEQAMPDMAHTFITLSAYMCPDSYLKKSDFIMSDVLGNLVYNFSEYVLTNGNGVVDSYKMLAGMAGDLIIPAGYKLSMDNMYELLKFVIFNSPEYAGFYRENTFKLENPVILNAPSMGYTDFYSDIDSQNIYNRIMQDKTNDNENCLKVINEYYKENDSNSKKLKEYANNVDIDKLNEFVHKSWRRMYNGNEEKIKTVKKFLHLINNAKK